MTSALLEEWLFIWIIPVVMFARVYFGFHWLGDTIGGASIGAAVAMVVFATLQAIA
jgi:membrane-associated phospholipid phosphatase